MSIVLRTNKGSALTYDEMDRNQSQFFYSSSKSPNGLGLRLHYTGSDSLDTEDDYGPTRYHEIAFPVFDSEVPDSNVAGDNTQIQFNLEGAFGAKSTFVFTNSNTSVGIGLTAPGDRLSIAGDGARSATISLSGNSATDSATNKANIKFFNTGFTEAAVVGQMGKLQHLNSFSNIDDVFIHAGNENYSSTNRGQQRRVHIAIGDLGSSSGTTLTERIGATFLRTFQGPAMVGINTTDPTYNLEIVGEQGIGLAKVGDPGKVVIKPGIDATLANVTDDAGIRRLFPVDSTTNGLQITTPSDASGGSILMVINTGADEDEGFNIITSRFTSANDTAELIASFQIREGKGAVGIGTNLPAHKGLTVQEKLSVKGLATGTSALTSALVATSTGEVQKVPAGPVPVGGIIMWSGATNAIPAGWRLCDGNSGTPNLTDKFIVGAGNTYNPGAAGGSKDAVLIQHNHGGTISGGSHRHAFEDGYYIESYQSVNDDVNGYDSQFIGNNFRGSGDTDANNKYIWERDSNTSYASHSHTIPNDPTTAETGVGKNLPPYYALAYIIYVAS